MLLQTNPEYANDWLTVFSNFGYTWLIAIAILLCLLIWFFRIVLPRGENQTGNLDAKEKAEVQLLESMSRMAEAVPEQNASLNYLVKKASENGKKISGLDQKLTDHIASVKENATYSRDA